jgi:hypothetical protein
MCLVLNATKEKINPAIPVIISGKCKKTGVVFFTVLVKSTVELVQGLSKTCLNRV